MYILVDTNVFLDFFLKREDYEDVKKFFLYCTKLNNKLFINALSLRDIEYVTHRALHNKDQSKRIQMLAYRMCYKIIGLSDVSTIEALYSDVNDYEDALMIEYARENGLDIIVTNNIKDYKNGHYPVFTPKELVDIWSRS